MNRTFQARAWIILLALAGGLLAFQLLERTQGWTTRSQAEQLGKELLAAQTPEQAKAIARELGELGDSAIRPLVQGLVSEEPLVSAAAGEEISGRLAAWRQLPRRVSGVKTAALARELATNCESIPPEQYRAARQWAEAILLWPLKGSAVDAAALLEDCEAILRLPEPHEGLVAERLARLQNQPPEAVAPENALEVETPPEGSSNLAPIVSPHDVVGMPTTSGSLADEDPGDNEPLPPHPREPRGIYVPRARAIEDAAPPREPKTLPPSEPLLLPPVKASAEAIEELTSMSEMDLMRDLHSESPAVVAGAENELARRGYKAVHLSLARQLTSPNSAVRLKLAQSLPRTGGIDPRPWLLRLSEDPDQSVRSAALSILRTSQDPELLQKLRR